MLIIYTNESNPSTLKVLIAANYANVNVNIKIVNLNACTYSHNGFHIFLDRSLQEPRHLPYLQINNDKILFVANAAVWYLFTPNDAISSSISQWLEWESSILSPNIAHSIGSSLKNEKSKLILTSSLRKLNASLQNKQFLIHNSISCADVVIWATLYPLITDKKLSDEYLHQNQNINTWFQKLEMQSEFKNALEKFIVQPGPISYNALLNGGKYVLLKIPENNADESQESQDECVTNEELNVAKNAWNKNLNQLPKPKTYKEVILPVPGEKNILITSALPYVNNVPHLGNIIGCVLSADVFARFSRLCNNTTLFISGTDEYGTATETKALEEGLTCKQICDKYYKIHNEIYKWFNISFDHFGRTSNPEQTELCQEIFLELNNNGFTFTQSVEQLHCANCDRYLADRFVEGGCPHIGCNYPDARGDQCDGCGKLVNAVELKNPRCKICNNSPKLKISNQFFIDLPKLEPLLHHWIKKSSPGWSHNAEVIGKAWLKEGLKPRCITRDLKWGVPVPLDGFRDKVFYVWFDAPIGYISISKSYTKEFNKWWKPEKNIDVKLYQFMAKDNVPFHSILFPGMMLGTNKGHVTVSHIMATEYLNYEDGKFSKSRGVGVFGNDAKNTGIPSDVWRFYLLYIRPESQDSTFSWSDLATKNNSELLNNLGNFVNRALVFAKNSFNKIIPAMEPTIDDYTLLALCTREYKGYILALEKGKLRDGIRHILAISRHGNQYMQSNQPWALLKGSDQEKIRAGTVIGMSCNIACLLAILLYPYMPDTSANLKRQLNALDTVIIPSNPEIINLLPPGHKLGEPSPLFAKIEPTRVEELKKNFAGKQSGNEVGDNVDLKTIEAEVAKQADVVRRLKSSGADKAVWQPELKILLDLKKKMEETLKTTGSKKPEQNPPVAQNGIVDPVMVKQLEEEIAKQGLVVRKLKEAGAEKSVWQVEVQKLLSLKSQLVAVSGEPIPSTQKSKKGKK